MALPRNLRLTNEEILDLMNNKVGIVLLGPGNSFYFSRVGHGNKVHN